jgi:hypothetical protein
LNTLLLCGLLSLSAFLRVILQKSKQDTTPLASNRRRSLQIDGLAWTTTQASAQRTFIKPVFVLDQKPQCKGVKPMDTQTTEK